MISADADFAARGLRERIVAPLLRLALQLALKPMLSPQVPIARQRRRVKQLAQLTRRRIAVDRTSAVGRHVGWQFRRFADAFPADLALSESVLVASDGHCAGKPSFQGFGRVSLPDASSRL